MMKALEQLKQRSQNLSRKVSLREKVGLGIILASVLLWYGHLGVLAGWELWQEQTMRLQRIETNARALPTMLQRYARYKARLDAVRTELESFLFQEGIRSHLETQLKLRGTSIQGTSLIKSLPMYKISEEYEQVPHQVDFTINDYEALVELFRELATGSKRFLFKKIEIRKNQGPNLRVVLVVSGISRVKKDS